MSWKKCQLSFVLVLFLTVSMAAGCGEDPPPSENDAENNQQEDAGIDVEDSGESDADIYATGEACPQSCVGSPGVIGLCDSCEDNRCITPGDPGEEAYCTHSCENNEDCEDADWECIDNICHYFE
jgi:hypothetical protein